jgi:uncharacterized membrane protein (DUF485 family)
MTFLEDFLLISFDEDFFGLCLTTNGVTDSFMLAVNVRIMLGGYFS